MALKALLWCDMGHTCCWPKQIAWPRWISVGQGGVFLPQEVTSYSMAMGKIITLKERGSKSLKATVQSNRISKRNFHKPIISQSRVLPVSTLLPWFKLGFPLPWRIHPEFLPSVVYCALRILRNKFYYLHKQRRLRRVKILKESVIM